MEIINTTNTTNTASMMPSDTVIIISVFVVICTMIMTTSILYIESVWKFYKRLAR